MADELSVQSSLASQSALSTTTEVLFRMWQTSCMKRRDTRKKDSLRKETKAFFESIVKGTQVQVGETTLTTKASHEEALALVIQQLGGAFSSHHAARVCALYALLGALEGCQQGSLSEKLCDSLTTFLQSHMGPLEQDVEDHGEDFDEQVRDAAMLAFTALLRVPCSQAEFVATIRKRLTHSETAVRNRCAVADAPEESHTGYEQFERMPKPIQSGLSMLPRSRRSLCFDVLRATVDSIKSICSGREASVMDEDAAELENDLIAFAMFTTNCLHGESDPRCLLQLLRLFHALMATFEPLFHKSSNFPLGDVFDAIAPYYPIQFNPPPNDVHGITKSGLRRALLSVMCYTEYDARAASSGKEDTMLLLSLGVILEQIRPLEGDEETNMTEKLEALRDLSVLLFSPGTGVDDDSRPTASFEGLTPLAMRQLSDSLISVHETASIEVVKGGIEESQAKETAELCRNIVARTALDAQRVKTKLLWEEFVVQPLRSLSEKVLASPSRGRVGIAYMASLCSSGGAETVRVGLAMGLAPLMDLLLSKAPRSDDDTATCVYGVGAFFSASNTSILKANEDGVALHPHPLSDFSAPAARILCQLSREKFSGDKGLSVRVAAVRGMESVMLASPASQFHDGDQSLLRTFLESTLNTVLAQSASAPDYEGQAEIEWQDGCAKTLGFVLSQGLESPDTKSHSVLTSPPFKLFIEDRMLPSVLSSCSVPVSTPDSARPDWMALGLACSTKGAASRVLQLLIEHLITAIREGCMSDILSYAKVLNTLIQSGGKNSVEAFHCFVPPLARSIDIIQELISLGTNAIEGREHVRAGFGTSLLQLPPSMEESEHLNLVVERLDTIACLLRPCYDTKLNHDALFQLVAEVSKALPPLENRDVVKVAVLLPLLSIALQNLDTGEGLMRDENLPEMLSDLADFALGKDFHFRTRSHASACLHGLLIASGPITDNSGRRPVEAIVLGTIASATQAVMSSENDVVSTRSTSVAECLGLLSVLASAAACGGESRACDRVLVFLVDTACSGRGSLSFDDEKEVDLDLSTFGENFSSAAAIRLQLEAASSIGSVLSSERCNSLTKQRLMSVSAKQIERYVEAWPTQTGFPTGVVATACNLVCAIKPQTMREATVDTLSSIVLKGFAPASLAATGSETARRSLRKLLLAATLKLLTMAPTTVSRNASYLVTGIMRAYVSPGNTKPLSDVVVKLLALQALEELATVEEAREGLLKTRPAVLSLLANAMNHPSSLLRQAGVEVRNAWYIVGNT